MPMALPLIGGAYQARAPIANAQRCINLFPENNRKDSPAPLTHYQRPGLRPLVQSPGRAVRCIYRASNGQGYCVIGQAVYAISNVWGLTQLGALKYIRDNPVSMTDNGIQILLVDGSSLGYTIDLATNAFAQFVDPTGLFQGATKVDNIDTFVIWNMPGTKLFGSTLSNTLSIDATYVAGKTNYPDLLQTLIVNRHEILLLGTLKSEIWYDAGNALFPFAELPGAYIEHGTLAPYSVASQDIIVYWLGQDLQGQGIVFMQRGYETKRISNHALEEQIRKMALKGTLTDAIGYTYQQGGHVFYCLTFPTGNQTWVYDQAIEDPMLAWHQRTWTDPVTGQYGGRDRVNCMANLYGLNVAGDWQNGTIYAVDPDYYVDTVNGQTCPISCVRTFPQIMIGVDAKGQPMTADGRRIKINGFSADIQCGASPLDVNGNEAQVTLRWSWDHGVTYGNGVLQTTGAPGEYATNPQWPNMGVGRFPVLELSYAIAGPAALNGGWVEAEVLPT